MSTALCRASAAQCNQSLASIANLCGRGIAACSWSAILPTPMRKYYHQMLLRKGEEVHLLSLTLTSGRLSHSVTVRGLVERNGPELIGAGSAMRDSGGVALSPQRRRLSSHKWGNIDPATEKANHDSSKLPAAMVHKAGEAQIERVERAMRGMEEENEDFTVRREGLHVFVDLAAGMGAYWVQYDKTLRQICLMSPRSGSFRYNFDGSTEKWIGEEDRHDFEGMLTRDIIQQAYGIPNFDAP